MAQEANIFGNAPRREKCLPEATDLNPSLGAILQSLDNCLPRERPIVSEQEGTNDDDPYQD
jgi:hypothetical protein